MKQHRRSRSLGEDIFKRDFTVFQDKPSNDKAGSLKLSNSNLRAEHEGQGLEQVKRKLLVEIKIKLKKQIELKQRDECHTETASDSPASTNEQGESVKQNEEEKVAEEAEKQETEKEGAVVLRKSGQFESDATISVATPPATADEATSNKRFSICYSPVYERTRKIVRQSSSSINRWSSSQPQVVPPQQQATQSAASPSEAGTVPALSPVTSKGDLEKEGDPSATPPKMQNKDSQELVPSQSEKPQVSSSSTTKNGGGYSAHPSVFVIEQDRRVSTSTGINDSRSEKMDRSTSTLKRGASFKGLRKNIKKVRLLFEFPSRWWW